MDTAFWHARWEAGEIGFHRDEIHVYLPRFWPRMGLAGGERVLVPLCGKSRDMLWLLEQGHRVVGVELSPIAVESFFRENGLEPELGATDRFTVSRLDEIELLCGDFFDLRPEEVEGVRAVYDRASLVALPPELRRAYARHLGGLLQPGTRVLLVTLDYPQEEMSGPPFSVTDPEVRGLFGEQFEIEPFDSTDILEDEPRFRQRGLSHLIERAYRLTRTG